MKNFNYLYITKNHKLFVLKKLIKILYITRTDSIKNLYIVLFAKNNNTKKNFFDENPFIIYKTYEGNSKFSVSKKNKKDCVQIEK